VVEHNAPKQQSLGGLSGETGEVGLRRIQELPLSTDILVGFGLVRAGWFNLIYVTMEGCI
jgi:hypothetical protein